MKRLHAEGKERVVLIIYVTADAQGTFGYKALFASFFAADIVKNAFSICYQNIRNDLLKSRVRFRLSTGHETIVFRIENGWQIMVHLSTEALKNTKLLKK